MSHMRTIHTSFTGYMGDHGHWPQPPFLELKLTGSTFYRFWIETLEVYGIFKETCLCPSYKLLLQMKKSETEKADRYFGSYVPTPFDKSPSSPLRWNQPWLIERGDFHGKGGHILMPDGSVTSARNPFHGR